MSLAKKHCRRTDPSWVAPGWCGEGERRRLSGRAPALLPTAKGKVKPSRRRSVLLRTPPSGPARSDAKPRALDRDERRRWDLLAISGQDFVVGAAGYTLSMCNLYSITKGQAAIRELARAIRDRTGNLRPLPGVFPDYAAPIVRTTPDGVRELAMARWGMPSPAFALKGKKTDPGVTNVRNTGSSHWRRWLRGAGAPRRGPPGLSGQRFYACFIFSLHVSGD